MTLEAVVSALEAEIRDRSLRNGWETRPEPGLEAADRVASSVEGAAPSEVGSTIPDIRRALSVADGRQTFLLAALPLRIDDTIQVLKRTLWWAASVRSQMPPERRFDLTTFFVAHHSPTHSRAWRQLADTIESDSRLCRKFVWLVDAEAEPLEPPVAEFLDRTLFARPWEATRELAARRLDPLEGIAQDDELLEAGIRPDTSRQWIEALATAEHGGAELAERLIVTLEKAGPLG